MTNYFSAMVISSSTDNRLKLRENNSQADAAANLIDIEALCSKFQVNRQFVIQCHQIIFYPPAAGEK